MSELNAKMLKEELSVNTWNLLKAFKESLQLQLPAVDSWSFTRWKS